MRSKLREFIEKEESWMNINSPAYLRDNVMNYIDIGIYKRLYLLKVFKYASLSLLSVSIILSTLLIVKRIEPTRMIFIYPHSDNIQNVEVIGNFNTPHEKVKMKLDEEKGIWKGVIRVRKKDVEDYVINVEEKDDDPSF